MKSEHSRINYLIDVKQVVKCEISTSCQVIAKLTFRVLALPQSSFNLWPTWVHLPVQVFEIKEIKEVGSWLVFLKFPGGLNPRGEIHEGRWHFCAFVFSV